jgi:hypothetical protein
VEGVFAHTADTVEGALRHNTLIERARAMREIERGEEDECASSMCRRRMRSSGRILDPSRTWFELDQEIDVDLPVRCALEDRTEHGESFDVVGTTERSERVPFDRQQ